MLSVGRLLKNALLVSAVMGFLSIAFFGVFHFGMTMSADGKMTDCPFMPGMSVCPMNPVEHAFFMQSFLTSIPQQENPVLAFLLALSFVVLGSVTWLRKLYAPPDIVSETELYFYRQRCSPILRLFQELFSSGILNPKPF